MKRRVFKKCIKSYTEEIIAASIYEMNQSEKADQGKILSTIGEIFALEKDVISATCCYDRPTPKVYFKSLFKNYMTKIQEHANTILASL